jgi:hypothetical protein
MLRLQCFQRRNGNCSFRVGCTRDYQSVIRTIRNSAIRDSAINDPAISDSLGVAQSAQWGARR